MPREIILFFLPLFLISQLCLAQEEKDKGERDFKQIEVPEIHYVIPDTATLFNEDELDESEESVVVIGESDEKDLEFKKELSIVSEDTSTLDEGFVNLVEISEELKIDCLWVTLYEYYSIWDSYNVDPYQIDGTKFSDTIMLTLYDTARNLRWAPPLQETTINSDFGMRHYRWHYGTDLELNTGDTVRAAFDGIVRIAKYNRGGYGYYVMLRHNNGLETLYGHLSKFLVSVGQVVQAGEVIGLGGSTGRSTGPHLHFEVRYQGNPIDPVTLYDFDNNLLLYDTLQVSPKTFGYLKEARKVIYHKIRSGDTLSEISNRYGISVNMICRFNGISKRTILRVGKRLRVR